MYGTPGFSGFTSAGAGGGGGTGNAPISPIPITSANFVDATNWNGANGSGVVLKPTDVLQVFANYLPLFLTENTDWERTDEGVNILIPGFDATQLEYQFYIFISSPN